MIIYSVFVDFGEVQDAHRLHRHPERLGRRARRHQKYQPQALRFGYLSLLNTIIIDIYVLSLICTILSEFDGP